MEYQDISYRPQVIEEYDDDVDSRVLINSIHEPTTKVSPYTHKELDFNHVLGKTDNKTLQRFSKQIKALQQAIAAGNMQRFLTIIKSINEFAIKDTSITEYLQCLLDPIRHTSYVPTVFKSKAVLVKVTNEFILSSNLAISVHVACGMTPPTGYAILSNVLNNGATPDTLYTNYVPQGTALPNYYSATMLVACMLTVETEASDLNAQGIVYSTSYYDPTLTFVNVQAAPSAYSVPASYTNGYYKYTGQLKEGAYALYVPPTDNYNTYSAIGATPQGPGLSALVLGSANQPIRFTVTTVLQCKPTVGNIPYLGGQAAKPGKPINTFDLGSVLDARSHLVTNSLKYYKEKGGVLRGQEILTTITDIPGVEDDDFWTDLKKVGLLALDFAPKLFNSL